MIKYFTSPAHMATMAMTECASMEYYLHRDQSWAGVSTTGIKAMLAKGGDESDVPRAKELLDRFALELPETEGAMFAPSVAGAYPCVPDAIMGMPESMRQRQPVQNDGQPIRLGVVTTVSAGIDEEAFRLKAAAILAILMHLNNAGRAVELYGISTMHGTDDSGETVLAYRIASSPLSLAECNMALGNLTFARRIPFAIAQRINGFASRWPEGFDHTDNGEAYTASLASRMGFQMILPPLYLAESEAIKNDPAKWMLAKYSAIQAQIGEGIQD